MVYPSLIPLMRPPRLNWRPADWNGLVRFTERRNLVSARVPSDLTGLYCPWVQLLASGDLACLPGCFFSGKGDACGSHRFPVALVYSTHDCNWYTLKGLTLRLGCSANICYDLDIFWAMFRISTAVLLKILFFWDVTQTAATRRHIRNERNPQIFQSPGTLRNCSLA